MIALLFIIINLAGAIIGGTVSGVVILIVITGIVISVIALCHKTKSYRATNVMPPPTSITMTTMPISTNATNQVQLPTYLEQQQAPLAYPQQVLQEYPPQQAYPTKA